MTSVLAVPPRSDFAQALSEAVANRGATLSALSQQLREAGLSVSIATLSYWQSGRSVPTRANSIKAVRVLEGLLELQPSDLVRTLPGNVGERWDPITELSRRPGMVPAMARLGFSPTIGHDYSVKFLEHRATINAGVTRQDEAIRQLLIVDGVELTHFPVVYEMVEGDPTPPVFTALSGCRVGGRADLVEAGLSLVELELPTTLHHGDMAVVEYSIDWDISAATTHGMVRGVPDGLDYLVQSVRFAGERPAAISRYEVTNSVDWSGSDHRTTEEMEPAAFVQQVQSTPTAGAVGLEWSFR